MKFVVDNKEYKILHKNNKTRKHSSLHNKTKQLLKELFPYETVWEEVKIPKHKLYVDFILPSLKIAIECQGRQHTQYVSFFGNKIDYLRSLSRDKLKRDLLEQNGFLVLEFFENEDITIWKKKLNKL